MSGLGIIDGFSAGLRILIDTVVIASSEGVATVKSVASNTIFRGIVTSSSSKTRDATIGNIVSSFTT